MSSYDADWLEFSKKSLKIGMIRAAIPMWLAYVIADYIYVPDKALFLFFIRLLIIGATFPFYWLGMRAGSKREFLRVYTGLVAFYSGAILLLTNLAGDPHNIYLTGDFLIAAGGLTFVIVPFGYFIVLSATIFLPFFVYAIATGMLHSYPYHFVVFLFTSIGLLVVCEHVRSYLEKTRLQEFQARNALAQVLAEKEAAIGKLASDITLLNSRTSFDFDKANRAARQAAHDIRSPVSAMNAIAKRVEDISPDLAEMLKLSSKRINDIADSLTGPAKQDEKNKINLETDVNASITAVVNEKLLRLNSRNVDIKVKIGGILLRVPIAPADFERLMSNLIENAIEAVQAQGQVEISATLKDRIIQIEIRDNGCGIPPEVLSKVGEYGFTFGKKNGAGLGFSHAREVVTSIGGTIKVASEVGKFTSVLIEVPYI